MLRRIILVVSLMLFMLGVQAQYKIVVVGSSTAYGTGAWPEADSSWVARLTKLVARDLTDGKDTVVYNLALGGTTTFFARETGCPDCPANRQPDPERNISKAMSLNANLLIVNFPTNDVANLFPTKTTMDNYRKYLEVVSPTIPRVIYLTPQPRTQLGDPNQKIQLREQVDSVLLNFPGNAVNVWSFLVDPNVVGNIAGWLDSGDGVHVNNDGHRLIFEAVSSFLGIAALPVKLSQFNAVQKNSGIELSWETVTESNNSHFEIERSTNGGDFIGIGRVNGKGDSRKTVRYTFTDPSPAPGRNHYRLKQVDRDQKSSYSQVIVVRFILKAQQEKLFPVPAHETIHVKLHADKKEDILLNIIDRSGNAMASFKRMANSGDNIFTVPLGTLNRGNYVMQICRASHTTTRSFIKL